MSSFYHQQQSRGIQYPENYGLFKGKKNKSIETVPEKRPGCRNTTQRLENNHIKEAQRTKGRCGESQQKDVWSKWKYK